MKTHQQLAHEPPVPLPDSISQLLTTSIQRETSYRSTCQSCRQQATFVSSRAIPSGSLPPVLSVNAAAFTDDALKIWRDRKTPVGTQRFLTPEITVNAPGGVQDGQSNDIKYKLRVSLVSSSHHCHDLHTIIYYRRSSSKSELHRRNPISLLRFAVRQLIEEASKMY